MGEEALRAACKKLIPPAILASPTSWRHVYDGEDPAIATQRAASITHWVEEVAPRELNVLLEQTRSTEATVSLEARAEIVATAARFIDPRKKPRHALYSLSRWTSQERDIWTSPGNSAIARDILQLPLLSTDKPSNELDAQSAVSLDIALYLLQQYIRPLFSATPSSSVNAKTGRAAPPIANLVDASSRRGAPLDDEVLWKGGDFKSARVTRAFGEPVLQEAASGSSVSTDIDATRHQALGCTGVLYVCCKSIQTAAFEAAQAGSAADHWTDAWPLVLPPLIQLLEDPSPRFRLLGTRILADAVLGCNLSLRTTPEEQETLLRYDRRLSTLLLRTGVASIFASVLDANVTYISHELAGALFQATSEAWLQLAMLTTDEMYGDSTQATAAMPNVKRDGGRARYKRLSKLIDDGVLRTWAYAPNGVRIDDDVDTSEVAEGFEEQGDTKDDSSLEQDDVVIATMITLAQLATPDNLGLGIVRYLDVCLEYLTAQMAGGIEAKVNRWRQKSHQGQSFPKPLKLNLRREASAADAIVAMVDSSRPCPALKAWVARCLTSAAKCWTLLDEARYADEYSERILAQLDKLVDMLRDAQEEAFESVSSRLVTMSPSAALRLKLPRETSS